jgi:type IV secretion system protein VirD4
MSAPRNPQARLGDAAVLVGIGAIGTGAVGHWLVANLATLLAHRRRLHVTVGEAAAALGRLADHWGDPRRAWPEPAASQLPGPVVYWISIVIVAGALIGLAVAAFMLRSRRHEPADKRRRVGVATQPRLARTRDLRPLLTRQPEPGRFVLARWRRRYLSTEADMHRRRRGVRGAVIVFGPSQSGKTTGLTMGVEAWDGPAIVSSVKTDLMRATLAARQDMGDVKVFDPVGISGLTTATWTPLGAARDLRGALAAAQILARASGDGPVNDRFWRGQAEQLIACMLWTAANTEGHSMANVVKWAWSSTDRGVTAGAPSHRSSVC